MGQTIQQRQLAVLRKCDEANARLAALLHNCDGSGPHGGGGGEVRILPMGGEGNAILCARCFNREIHYRQERNRGLGAFAQFSLPRWEELEVYAS